MSSSVAHAQVINLDVVGRSELPISITNLESHSSMVVVGKIYQSTSDAGRTVEFIPVVPDYESTYQVPIVNSTIRHGGECTGESCALIVKKNTQCSCYGP